MFASYPQTPTPRPTSTGATNKDDQHSKFESSSVDSTAPSLRSTFQMHIFQPSEASSAISSAMTNPPLFLSPADEDCVQGGSASTMDTTNSDLGVFQQPQHSNNNDDSHSVFYHHEEGSADELEALNKLITLQSIDRLENHIPHIVAEQLLLDMKQRRDQTKREQHPLLGRGGAITLELPMASASNTNSVNMNTNALAVAAAATAPSPDPCRRMSVESSKTMNDLLNTLSSLDELLEEEFSSSGEEGSSSEEDEDDSSDDDSDDDDADDEGESDSDSEEEGESSSGGLDHSALTFAEDDGVSDLGEDDGISDLGEDDRSAVSYDLGNEDLTEVSSLGGAPKPDNLVGSSGLSFGGNSSLGQGTTHTSGARSCNSNRSLRRSVQNNAEAEVGKLRQGRLNNRRLESDTSADDRSMSVDLTTLSTKSEQQSHFHEVQASHHVSAILFVDISGFTKLSRSLEVEALSEVRLSISSPGVQSFLVCDLCH
jgi:hypothetical protein